MRQTLSALFIGDSTLLMRCADAFVSAGHSIAGVVSGSRQVLNWAQERGLVSVAKGPGFETQAMALEFDVVFSVANLDMVSANVLGRAKMLGLNFHDGPLPLYAGLNVPAWALLEGRREYGVVWHEMTATPDAGRIAASATIEIGPLETALSLNTKCYEAGLTCFEEMVALLGAGALRLAPQEGERTYYARAKRPLAAATLNFAEPGEHIAATVRALDFGPYANPLACPKVLVDGAVVLVGSAEVIKQTGQSSRPGEVLSRTSSSVDVATSTLPVRLSRLRLPDGSIDLEAIAGLAPGRTITSPPKDISQRIDALNGRAAKAENWWLDVWARASPIELPYPRLLAEGVSGFHRLIVPTAGDVDQRLAAVAAWARAVTDRTKLALGYRSQGHDELLGDAAPWFSAWRPLILEPGATTTIGELSQHCALARAEIEAAAPLACDLRHRYSVGGPELPVPTLGVFVGSDITDVPPEIDIVACLNKESASIELLMRRSAFDEHTARVIGEHLTEAAAAKAATGLSELTLDPPNRRALFAALSKGPVSEASGVRTFDSVSAQARRTPDRIAVQTRQSAVTYAELDKRVERTAAALVAKGVRRGDVVGVSVERAPDLVVALLGVQKAGAAYLPLDRSYPKRRLEFMLADARARFVITNRGGPSLSGAPQLLIDELAIDAAEADLPTVAGDDIAYLIYTSGSTGKPKGVMIAHRALENFFLGMDERIPHDPPGTWLAVTSTGFDISVLELFWTLMRGFTVALHTGFAPQAKHPLGFSLFYFGASAGSDDGYRLLVEGARFADANGFEAVWTPERHFHEFGGPYPNPAITGALIAGLTKRIQIRAGSCVLPLHHPIRVAEDWSVVDNISGGRVGLAFASGWHANDFALAPDEFKDRKATMLQRLQDVRRLWRGESVAFVDGEGACAEIRTLPRPIQNELPVWLTAARSPETFERAGELGCNVLTHLLGMSFEEVAGNIARYRAAWQRAGHQGQGRVTLMLHTFVGADAEEVRSLVRGPMKNYLRSAVDLVRSAAWTFPTIAQRALSEGKTPGEVFDAEPLSDAELDAVLEHAFERYYGSSGLFGTPDACLRVADKAAAIGVDEIACLIDFGVESETVLSHLQHLHEVMQAVERTQAINLVSVADDLRHFRATHLQCTPSLAAMIVEDARMSGACADLQVLMVGGETLNSTLAEQLRALAPQALLLNMYGPTETTIWSSTCELSEIDAFVPLGAPIANTTFRVVGADGRDRPALASGELLIGGAGLAVGYWDRPDLTKERFIQLEQLMYRTGDLVRRHPDGRLEFLGRIDQQVKLRGHRIELGEIEAELRAYPDIVQAAVVLRSGSIEDSRLVAYYAVRPGGIVSEEELRERMAARLPPIMVPSAYCRVQTFPLTANGKIDRKALPAPETSNVPSSEAELVGLEQTIAGIWSDVLGRDRVGATQNFFDLGGHSLLAVQLQRRMRVELPDHPVSITDIFQFPTVRALAAHIGGASLAGEAAMVGAERAHARIAARRRRKPITHGLEG